LLRRIFNSFILPKAFGAEKATAWLTHNVEEVGCFEHFLPSLYARRDQGKTIRLDTKAGMDP